MIRLDGLSAQAGAFRLGPLDLEVARGGYFVLFGPSGQGKSVLVETVAGLRRPAAGRVAIGGRDVTALPPERRGIGYVPQGGALFPHLSVAENVAFPIRVRDRPPGEIERTVGELLALVGVAPLAGRAPDGLSGGERRRVAIARALAAEPEVLLLDEPFAALDAESGPELRQALRAVHERLGTTTLHVDHDLDQAGALADHVGILIDGRLIQTGPPDEVFRRPATPEVARFVGVRNLLDGEVLADPADGAARFRAAGLDLRVVTDVRGRARASLRPEEILVSQDPLRSSAANSIPAEVQALDPSGPLVHVTVRAAEATLVAVVLRPSAETLELAPGKAVWLTFKASAAHVF